MMDSFALDFQLEFTDAHIIGLYYYHDGNRFRDDPTVTLLQIFTIPPDGSSVQVSGPNPVLNLTHEGFANRCLLNLETMKPSIDPITGATHMRFLEYYNSRYNLKVTRIDLTLPKPSGLEVLPMTVGMHNISLNIPTQERIRCFQYLDLCDGRLLRGFYGGKPLGGLYQRHVMKFAIDVSQDRWDFSHSPAQMLATEYEWSDVADPAVDAIGRDIVFDGLRGRLCYVDREIKDQIVVVDVE